MTRFRKKPVVIDAEQWLGSPDQKIEGVDVEGTFTDVKKNVLQSILAHAADDWDALPWWRRWLGQWITGRDWGYALRTWSDLDFPEGSWSEVVDLEAGEGET